MIRFSKWHNPRTDREIAAVRITFYLDRETLARVLIRQVYPVTYTDLSDLTPHQVDTRIREELRGNGTERSAWWRDEYADEYDHEITADEAWDWAIRQVGKL